MKNKIYLIIVAILMFSCKDTNQLQAHKLTEPSVLAETPKTHATINAEIVFCLNATGSMDGLIGTAKEKIWDIVSDYKNGKLELDKIKNEKLPENLKGKTLEEKKKLVKELSEKRKADNKKLKVLLLQKRGYIADKVAEDKSKLSFSKEILKVMKKANKTKL